MLGFIFIAIAMMLWFYSAQYKKTAFWGNFVIALLSAMVVLIVWLFEFFALRANPINYTEAMKQLELISAVVAGYAIFAFLVSMIREIMKDVEDIEGDKAAGYKTSTRSDWHKRSETICHNINLHYHYFTCHLPIFSFRNEADACILVFTDCRSIVSYLPGIQHIVKAKTKEDFHFLSNAAKIIMVAGILSMQLFYISY